MTARGLPFAKPGRFFRGNVHCHSNRSDGTRSPEDVVAAYREAGYDFLVLSDHFESEYGWRITDTRRWRTDSFTTIVGAELSSAAWTDRDAYWVTAVGLPVDFAPPDDGGRKGKAEAIRRAHDQGAFVVMLHPGLNNLPLAAAPTGADLAAIDAVEIYNHSMAVTWPHGSESHYFYDGMLERGHRLLAHAADDAHFVHPHDRFGGFVRVRAEDLEPESLLAALKRGDYYSSQGPEILDVTVDGDVLSVWSGPARAIVLSGGGDRWSRTQQALVKDAADPLDAATFSLEPFRGSYCRVTVVGLDGRRAWTNPLWPT